MKDLPSQYTSTGPVGAPAPSYLTLHQQESKYFYWWYRLASPSRPDSLAPFKEKERFRRGRTGSQIIPALYVLLLVSFPAGFAGTNPFLTTIVIGGLLALTMATIFNRLGMVNTAGFIVLLTFTAYPMVNIATTPGGLGMLVLPLFGLLILPVLCAISFLPEWWAFVVAAVNILFTVFVLIYLPQTAELNAILVVDFAGIVTPIILSQMIVSVVAYLWVHGTTQALRRADRAEEIARLEHDLALQAEASGQQQQQLESSIQKIVETHMRVANGEFSARVPLTEDNVLWQISGSLNNLLSRLQRLHQDSAELQQMKYA
ncbi:MAG TPA: hypothetical protein VFN35_10655, partial [Ktedonobacteraceae bacterium]|nr:hypothetical protein [Ktedonobacteraceae bacterium]